jgi:hypothetical protein
LPLTVAVDFNSRWLIAVDCMPLIPVVVKKDVASSAFYLMVLLGVFAAVGKTTFSTNSLLFPEHGKERNGKKKQAGTKQYFTNVFNNCITEYNQQ